MCDQVRILSFGLQWPTNCNVFTSHLNRLHQFVIAFAILLLIFIVLFYFMMFICDFGQEFITCIWSFQCKEFDQQLCYFDLLLYVFDLRQWMGHRLFLQSPLVFTLLWGFYFYFYSKLPLIHPIPTSWSYFRLIQHTTTLNY